MKKSLIVIALLIAGITVQATGVKNENLVYAVHFPIGNTKNAGYYIASNGSVTWFIEMSACQEYEVPASGGYFLCSKCEFQPKPTCTFIPY